MALFDIGLGSGRPADTAPIVSPDAIKRRRDIAARMLAEGSDLSPIKSPWQGAARIANALAGNIQEGRANEQEQAGMADYRRRLSAALTGADETGATGPTGTPGPTVAPQPSGQMATGDSSVPAAIRNNNPGAMWPGPSSQTFGATGSQNLSSGNKIAQFPDAESGAAAQFDLLSRKYSGMPLSSAIEKWSGGNASPAYTNFVSAQTGLSPRTVLTPELLASPQGIALAKSMSRWESGRDFPMNDQQWASAQSKALGRSAGGNTTNMAALLSHPYSTTEGSAAINKSLERNAKGGTEDLVVVNGKIVNKRTLQTAWEPAEDSKPELKDIMLNGVKTSVWHDPKTGALKLANVEGGTQVAGADDELMGDEYAKSLPQDRLTRAKGLIDYTLNPQSMSGRVGKNGVSERSQALADAKRLDPEYDQSAYPAKAAMFKEFLAGGKTSPAGVMTSGLIAIGHMGRLFDRQKKIGGTDDWGFLNKPLNYLNAESKEYSQNPNYKAYMAEVKIASEEIKNFYTNGGGSLTEYEDFKKSMNAADSPAAREEVLKGQADFMMEKVRGYVRRYQSGMAPGQWKKAVANNPEALVADEVALNALKKLRGVKNVESVIMPKSEDRAPQEAQPTQPPSGTQRWERGPDGVPRLVQ